MPGRLEESAVTVRLRELPGWTRDGDRIVRTVEAPSFMAGIDLVGEVARAAEEADHHPDIDIRWRRVTFALTTHSAGGLTERDFALARTIDEIAGRHGVR